LEYNTLIFNPLNKTDSCNQFFSFSCFSDDCKICFTLISKKRTRQIVIKLRNLFTPFKTYDMKNFYKLKFLLFWALLSISSTAIAQQSVARQWNEALLHAIRNDFARPTVHARNLFHSSIAMWDTWAVYDDVAETFFLGKDIRGFICEFNGVPTPVDVQAAREEAMSYAVYRLLFHRFLSSPGAVESLTTFNDLFTQLGYDPGFTSTDYSSGIPAALGNYLAQELINFGHQDGANEENDYANEFYEPINPPLITNFPGNPDMIDPNRWQPLTLDVFIDQSGNEIPFNTPDFLGPEWGSVVPFALKDEDLTLHQRYGDVYWTYHDPGGPPYIDTTAVGGMSEEYKWGFELVSVWSSQLDPEDGVMWDISPANIGNVQEYPTTIEGLRDFYNLEDGGDYGIGHAINPYTGLPYEPQIVPRADYGRVLAEFWADGPDSETPPGHWFTILNYVNDNPVFEKRYRGEGEILDDLEWDVKAYFMLAGAVHDCAVASWGIKGWYDYLRPISAIRSMAERGQSSDPGLPSYHPGGINLKDGYIALVDSVDALAGVDFEHVGKIKLKAWRGHDYIVDPETEVAGVGWILAENWWPYQRPTFVTPPFAGYVSGHSTFSRAAAEVLTMLTGDAYFPGGMGVFDAVQNEFLVFEDGPSVEVFLQWATYRDASDQCSLSRIWGGIHPPADDVPGRLIGEKIGVDAFHYAETYFFYDGDGDGYFDFEDCDDNDESINPGATELCDGIDNNCNGLNDDGIATNAYYFDNDNDGFGDIAVSIDTCISEPPAGYVLNNTDCDDNNELINPDAEEIPNNGIDEDCDGMDLTIGTKENNLNDLIEVFPNPVKNVLTINYEYSGKLNLQIFTNDGKLLAEKTITFLGNTANFDFSIIPQGVYFLRLSDDTGENQYLEKIIKH
jgi:Domain of unknown function (DUF6851)/Putative metal-binding motif/Secretion system C-terminal sorting domain